MKRNKRTSASTSPPTASIKQHDRTIAGPQRQHGRGGKLWGLDGPVERNVRTMSGRIAWTTLRICELCMCVLSSREVNPSKTSDPLVLG